MPTHRERVLSTWNAEGQDAIEHNKDITPLEYDVTCKNGEVKTILIGGVTFGEDFIATFIDLTKTKEYEKKLNASQENLKRKNLELDE